jgi:putative transposase
MPEDGRDRIRLGAVRSCNDAWPEYGIFMTPLPDRCRPTHGVNIDLSEPTIVFVTVCTQNRARWLAQPAVQQALLTVWNKADAWAVGAYVLMPDHLHLFCAPRKITIELSTWIRHWKRAFSLMAVDDAGSWQRDYWDTRLRRHESYSEKWEYVRNNPVRAGLAKKPKDWPFWGVVNELRW